MHLSSTAPSTPPDPNGRLSIEQLLEGQPILSRQILIVCLCFAVAAFDGLDLAIMGFIAPALRGEWHLQPPQLGALFSAGLIGLAIGALTAGPAADRIGRKRVLILAVSVFGSMCVASAYARNPQDLWFLRLLTGLGLGAAAPNAITLTSEYTPARKRSSMVTTMFCGFNLGSALGGLVIVPLLLPHIGWRGIFIFIGLLPVILVPFLALLLPESLKYLATRVGDRPKMDAILRRVFPRFQGDSQAIVIASENKREASAVSGLFTERLRGCTFLLWPVFFMNLLVIYLISNWLPTVIKDSGFSTTMASVIVSSFQIGGMLGSFSIGYFMDRRRPESVILAVYLLGAVSTAAVGFASCSPALLAACSFVVGSPGSGGLPGDRGELGDGHRPRRLHHRLDRRSLALQQHVHLSDRLSAGSGTVDLHRGGHRAARSAARCLGGAGSPGEPGLRVRGCQCQRRPPGSPRWVGLDCVRSLHRTGAKRA